MAASVTASASGATCSKLPRDFLPLLNRAIHSSSGVVVSASVAATDPANDCWRDFGINLGCIAVEVAEDLAAVANPEHALVLEILPVFVEFFRRLRLHPAVVPERVHGRAVAVAG